ncbi:MAG: hypothetical protein D6820_09040 [Lentisphaerae bacterium]|nr:MAG: hypothetical protein D6820_09040 [Lentisphaerota bacterium]
MPQAMPTGMDLIVRSAVLGLALFFTGMGRGKARDFSGRGTPRKLLILGDNLTLGYPGNPEEAYPKILQKLAGANVKITTVAHLGAGISPYSPRPWQHIRRFRQLQQADEVWIQLGLNDLFTDPKVLSQHYPTWVDGFFQYLKKTFPRAGFSVLLPLPIDNSGFAELSEERLSSQILPVLSHAAKQYGWKIIDLHQAFRDAAPLFPDGLHPSAEGHRLLAQRLLAELLPVPYTDPAHGCYLSSSTLRIVYPQKQALVRYAVGDQELSGQSPVAPSQLTLPRSGKIRFALFRGDRRFSPIFEIPVHSIPCEPALTQVPDNLQPGIHRVVVRSKTDDLDKLYSSPVLEASVQKNIQLPRRRRFFGLIFRGLIHIPRAGIWQFATDSDDGSRLFIDDILVVDNHGSHAVQRKTGRIRLQEGYHHIRLDYQQGDGELALRVQIKGPHTDWMNLPEKLLRYAPEKMNEKNTHATASVSVKTRLKE